MERNPVFSQGTKRLLKNFIRHTDTHNRIQEENDMWKQYEKSKEDETRKYTSRHQASYLEDNRDDMNDVRYKMKSRSAHMDDNTEETSTYWMRQLEKTEAADPERWGHSGFKELYPTDFNSDRSDQDSSSSSSSSSSASSSEEERRKRKKRKKKRSRKKVEEEWVERESVRSKNTDLNNRKTKKRKSEQYDNMSYSVTPPKRLKKHKNKDKHKKKKKHKKHKE